MYTETCTKFGGSASIEMTFTIRLFTKDTAGNKSGPVLATINRSAVIKLDKPANANRLTFEEASADAQPVCSPVQ